VRSHRGGYGRTSQLPTFFWTCTSQVQKEGGKDMSTGLFPELTLEEFIILHHEYYSIFIREENLLQMVLWKMVHFALFLVKISINFSPGYSTVFFFITVYVSTLQ
jgi:hypothetical protein